MSKKKKNNQLNDVVKALRRAERELQLERNGYGHPWVAMTITYKNKKACQLPLSKGGGLPQSH